MAQPEPQEFRAVQSKPERQLTEEEIFDFFKTLAQAVIDHGGMTVADVESVTLDETDTFNKEILYSWWTGCLIEPRFHYDTIHLSLRRARAREQSHE